MAAKKIKTFGGSGKVNAEPIKFDVAGVEIEALPQVAGLVTLEFLEGISSDEAADNLHAVRFYLDHSFDAENKKKFTTAVNDPKNGFELTDISEIMNWLVEARSGDSDLAESSES